MREEYISRHLRSLNRFGRFLALDKLQTQPYFAGLSVIPPLPRSFKVKDLAGRPGQVFEK
jgi:hypothetical protein